MTPTEALVEHVVLVIFRVLLVAFALACAALAFLTLRQKRGNENSTELTMEKGGYKIQIVRVGPFIAFMAMAAFGLYEACNAQFPRLMVADQIARPVPHVPPLPPPPQVAPVPPVSQVTQQPQAPYSVLNPFFVPYLVPVREPSVMQIPTHIPPTTLPVHEGDAPVGLPRNR